MFSKYSNFEIPQNYSGNRFKKTQGYETTTKTHTPSEYSAIKSSVSPTYQNRISKALDADIAVEDEADDAVEYKPEELENHEESNETIGEVCEIEDKEAVCEIESAKKQFSLNDLISKFNSEDLLLICLIVFLSLDKTINNSDIIILLSLLLAR